MLGYVRYLLYEYSGRTRRIYDKAGAYMLEVILACYTEFEDRVRLFTYYRANEHSV